jgi:hypothetical protein
MSNTQNLTAGFSAATEVRPDAWGIGDVVSPKTPAGLELADVASTGEYNQQQNVSCVFKGVGRVINVHYYTIDYDEWERLAGDEPSDLGTVRTMCCLIQCDAGIGWAGGGALISAA